MFINVEDPHIWNKCLDLAVEAFNSGSMAISAVVANNKNEIVGFGRNHRSVNDNVTNFICGSSIAHAEINAIHSIKEESLTGEDLIIYTTVEPCPMCLGAIAMSRIRKILVGSKDPHAGSLKYLNSNDYVKSKNITYKFIGGSLENVFFGIHYLSIMRIMQNRRPHIVFENMKQVYSEKIERIESIVSNLNINELKLSRKWIEEYIELDEET